MPKFYVIFARKKIIKMPEFLMIFSLKVNKIPEFYMIFVRKMLEFYMIIARKYCSRFSGGFTPRLLRLYVVWVK